MDALVAGDFTASHGKRGIAFYMDCAGTSYFTDSRASIIADCTISGQFKGGSVIFVISPEHNCAAPMSGVSGNRAAGHRSAGVFIQQKTGRTVQRRGNRSVVVGNLAAGDFDMCTIACADNSAVRYPIAGQGIIRDFAARQGKDCVSPRLSITPTPTESKPFALSLLIFVFVTTASPVSSKAP